jgi:hypothetical protein
LTTSFLAYILSFAAKKSVHYNGDPMSSVYFPVFDSFDDDSEPVAVIVAVLNWATYFKNTLPPNSDGVVVVLENDCDGPFTYFITHAEVEYLGKGDLHNEKYDAMEVCLAKWLTVSKSW